MISKEFFGFLSVGLSAVGCSSYIVSVLKKRTKPHAFSWTVWGVLMGIVFFAHLSKNAGPGAWVTGFSATICFVFAGLATIRGEKNITRGDWVAFGGALSAIPLWYMTKNPLSVVILATLIDALAYYPTFRKSWNRPFEENFFSFSMDICKWIAALWALNFYSAVTLMYPLFLLSANSALVVMIISRRSAATAIKE